MTDRFEEAVRSAARGLGEPGSAPTYHNAWQRGRRRRASKQAALAFGGAAVLVALLTVGLPGLNGSRPDGDDLAVDLQAGAPGAVLATPTVAAAGSVPVPAPTPEPAVDPAAIVAVDPSQGSAATTSPPPAGQSAESPATSTPRPGAPTPQPTRVASPQPPATAVAPTPRPATTTSPTAALEASGPTAVPTPSDQSTFVAPSPIPGATSAPESPDLAATPTPAAAASLQTNEPAAAVVIGPLGTAAGTRCDTNRDGVADATCQIQWPYACSSDTDARLGYLAVDLNGNGLIDTCTPTSTSLCDTTGDGLGDTACIIKPDPAQG